MKKSIIGLMAALTAALMAPSCSGHHENSGSAWPPTTPQADSLTSALDSILFHREEADAMRAPLAELGRISARSGDQELNLRYAYFDALLTLREGDAEGSERKCRKILAKTDSATHPYLYNRTLHLADNDESRTIGRYDRICDRLHYFESEAGDDLMAATQYTELGNLMKNVRHTGEAMTYYRKADSLYRLTGYADQALFNSINMASAMAVEGDTVAAVAVLERLRRDRLVADRPGVMEIVLHNLYSYTSDSSLPYLIYSLQEDDPAPMTLTFIAQEGLEKGAPRRAADFAATAFEKAAEEGDGNALAWSAYAAASAYEAMERPDSAYQWLRLASDITDQVALLTEKEEIADSDLSRAISMRRLERELDWNRRMLRLALILFSLTLVLIAAAWLTARRIRNIDRLRKSAEADRLNISRKLMATQIAREESEQLIDSVGKRIGDMTDSGHIADHRSRPIVNAIRTHAIQREERETFIESFAAVHPEFAARLHEKSEAMTDLDIRLASYIVTGMDTKHIASTMGVRPESVKQARWRIRTKLGLARGESLEEALRSLID